MRFVFSFLLLILFAANAYSQKERRDELKDKKVGNEPTICFENKEFFFDDDSLNIAFDFVTDGRIIGTDEALILSPVYISGNYTVKLPFVLINGKKRNSFYKREMTFASHEQYVANKPLIRAIHKGKGKQTISYNIAYHIPEHIAKDGKVFVKQYLRDCCDLKYLMEEEISNSYVGLDVEDEQELPKEDDNNLLVAMPLLSLDNITLIKPEKELKKERSETLSLMINFIVNRHDILPGFSNNYLELQRVDSLLAPLSARKDLYTINFATIKGYASPEATYEHNLKLSQRRADSFKNYIMSKYKLYNISKFPAIGMGEDWKGLRAAVEASNMDHKSEILYIIDEVGIFSGREKRLMELEGGIPYRYMLNNLYPPLRRMEMQVAYTVNPFDLDQSMKIIKRRPQDLSHEEIYAIAQENNKRILDRNIFGEEYVLAAKIFPNDILANINASSAWIVRGDLETAWEYLKKVKEDYRAYNNLALYYWCKGDLKNAETYFIQAIKSGFDKERALYNYKKFKQEQVKK